MSGQPKEMAALNLRSAAKRTEKAALKTAIKDGTLSIGEVLARPPDLVLDVPLVDLVRWQFLFGPTRLQQLGKAALKAKVNLLIELGKASPRTRYWLANELGASRDYYQASKLFEAEVLAA